MLFGEKRNQAKYLRMIEVRERVQVNYSDSPGFEGTDQALFLAQVVVYKGMVALNTPLWAVKGDKEFRKYLKKTQLKVPTYDFNFIAEYTEELWDVFRFILMRPDNRGAFHSTTVEELRSEFIEVFMQMPSKFRVKDGTELAAVNLLLASLKICLEEDKQTLANPIFEIVLLIWYHYIWNTL